MSVEELAREFLAAYEYGSVDVAPPSVRDPSFDMAAAYAVEGEFSRLRARSGRARVGRKVGYANKAMWRALKMDTLVWAGMYDDTIRFADSSNHATLSMANYGSRKIEPELVFKLKSSLTTATSDAAAVLAAVDWMAIGFEIIDCPYPGWQFKPVDFVAAYGLHKALVIGERVPVETEAIPDLVNQLAGFKVRLLKNGELVEEGWGKNSLKSPALCLAELAGVTPLGPGELISTGTLTSAPHISAGETWQVEVEGLPLPALTLTI
ncbi:MAG TPA: fumarylacetoacetate hydrolase family protein [Bryobacteraceae bacterium]|jgi:2-oxo-3-hexenedioate decarboxylase|nr:fumarylacetoacetate hydrolase family protein [Bryobacteraceae bacterium]